MTSYFKESEIPSIVEQARLLAEKNKHLFKITANAVSRMNRIGSYEQNSKNYEVYAVQIIKFTYLMCIERSSDIRVHNIVCCSWSQEPKFEDFKIPSIMDLQAMRSIPQITQDSYKVGSYQHENITYLVWFDWDYMYFIRGAKKIVW